MKSICLLKYFLRKEYSYKYKILQCILHYLDLTLLRWHMLIIENFFKNYDQSFHLLRRYSHFIGVLETKLDDTGIILSECLGKNKSDSGGVDDALVQLWIIVMYLQHDVRIEIVSANR